MLDGDKSPAESADKFAHSKSCSCGVTRVSPICVRPWFMSEARKICVGQILVFN